MNCVIYGAGSLGTVLGAYLSREGVDITLVNRNQKHIQALREHGARITGTVDMTVPVKAMTPDEMQGPYDVIFLMTKQLQNPQVAAFLKPMLAEDGVVVTMQNGLPEPGLAEILGSDHVIGCVVEWGAGLQAPGHCVLTSEPDSLSFHMGGMEGVSKEKLQAVRALLEHMCPVEVELDLMGARWSKLLINATFSGLGTVVGGTFGSVSEVDPVRSVALDCMKECIDVGHAAGITFAPVQGKDITRLFYWKTSLKHAIAMVILPIAMKKHRDIVPSMLQDIRNGKPCEVDAINGVVSEWGRKYGVATPVNDWIAAQIHLIQEGKLTAQASNIHSYKRKP